MTDPSLLGVRRDVGPGRELRKGERADGQLEWQSLWIKLLEIQDHRGVGESAGGRSATGTKLLAGNGVEIPAELQKVDWKCSSEHRHRGLRGDEPTPASRRQLADRGAVVGDDKRFALVESTHDLSAVVAELTLVDLLHEQAVLHAGAQRIPANRSSSGTGVPVRSTARTNISLPNTSVKSSRPMLRKKMLSAWLA